MRRDTSMADVAWAFIKRIAGPALALLLLGFCFNLLWREASQTSQADFLLGITGVGVPRLLIAAALIALNYSILVTYDILALHHLNHPLSLRRTAIVSFLGYSIGNNLGTMLAATPIRFRFYTRWGLKGREVVAVIALLALTYYCGASVLLGLLLCFDPPPLPPMFKLPISLPVFGMMLLLAWAGYLMMCLARRRPIRVGGFSTRLPKPGLALVQTGVAAIDLAVSGTALYVLLPGTTEVPYPHVLASYLMAMGFGLIAQVPGQIGVLDAALLTLLKNEQSPSLLGTIMLFRGLYYILPLILGGILLVVVEWQMRTTSASYPSSESPRDQPTPQRSREK